ncbi:undecaprenyl-diphosphate phosphatase [Geomesophilobacter sediminis]|uniref:Undecaprenyl-diphosphatase n=1 Tax=Geomesophilobacter sediminis TaxID=2798584 RepID=A0A8J7IMB9_9BACT|nr:undecaprenyl-diphosphate phosphatase [Geomesophilobacter sediminis]MBJ6723843.1 undecaprenyl-diphosphate phosphatase [Geomesophilobacter sediminis]
MTFLNILILAVVQGAAELLPVSSSAHVIVAEKLLGLDPTKPEMTLLLVLLHTGTMFAVIWYFRRQWRESFFSSAKALRDSAAAIIFATVCTGVVGLLLKWIIEKTLFRGAPHAEIELLFGNLALISGALAAAGILIIVAGLKSQRSAGRERIRGRDALIIGAVQGICLPFRGFSRSGATISAGLLLGLEKVKLEAFSFALAVVLTPPVVARELLRMMKAQGATHLDLPGMLYPGLLGMVLSFVSGLAALKWLSSWLEEGRWQYFGYYCLAGSVLVFTLYRAGF